MNKVTLFENKKELNDFCKQNGVSYLGMFGSYARGEAQNDSDIDLLVDFNKSEKIGLFRLSHMQEALENRFGRSVDLITKIDPHVKPYIYKDLVELYRI
ncbi:nucleotidyltransferase [candidate division WWE3 bacterium CG_4_9_14_3_um_filter_41_6]|uniref:Nucleotidyltransferase n=1 Tax=candidate division WWE3 bacterium CG_4_10_14_0_2_um_filter_41_14 TaxID=1975072 RepID=A0A2M7TM04_UNCKA|nr:MAG: nucleotidyltransferase [candidate division WWE3 bacterium CG_4_10_14_0_2_um_filter_41_14]PJA39450.1 MAG: nucleotidyltransferase [candidate division WWE3 bacterium CG_4_9_14_3_um_filter_41_6]